MFTSHNDLCDKKSNVLYDNIADINSNIINYEGFKENLINYLNKNPLVSIYEFKKYALKLFLSSNNNCNFTLKKILFQAFIILGEVIVRFLVHIQYSIIIMMD